MNIYVGKYKISSSSHDVSVSVPRLAGPDAKNAGEELLDDRTFHPNLASALNNVLQRRVKESYATTLMELLTELKQAKKELWALWGEVPFETVTKPESTNEETEDIADIFKEGK